MSKVPVKKERISRKALSPGVAKVLKRLHFPVDVILLCVRWYVAYSLSLRDLEETPRVRILVAPLESVNPGGDDEKANWQNTDKHSRTERLRGCCRRRARRWKTLRVRLA